MLDVPYNERCPVTDAATIQPDAATTTSPNPRGLTDLLARPMHWLTGPILDKELRVASRRKRLYALRTLYLTLMALILVPAWNSVVDSGYYRGNYYGDAAIAYRMADLGRTIVPFIVWMQYVAVQLVAMLTMSTSVSDEIARRTLGTLLTTPMNAWQLVMGKLASRLVQCVSLLAMSLPVLALLTVFGGVQWSFVLIGLALTFSTLLIVSSVTMFFSILNRRSYLVFIESLLTVAVLIGGSVLFLALLVGIDVTTGRTATSCLTIFHPVMPLIVETASQSGGRVAFGSAWLAPWWVNVIVSVAFSALVLCLCVRIVRRASLAAAMGMSMSELRKHDKIARMSTPPPTATPSLPPMDAATLADASPASIKPLRGNPVYWKDTVRRRLGLRTKIIGGVVLAILLLSYGFVFYLYGKHGYIPHDMHAVFLASLGILGGLIAIVVSAGVIPAEREARGWDMVLTCPLTDGQIVWGKFLAALRRFWPAYIPLLLHPVLFAMVDSLRPLAMLHVVAIVAGSAVFIAALGVLVGTYVRRTTAALVTMLLLCLFLWAGLPLLGALVDTDLHARRGDRLAENMLDVNPIVQLIVTGEGSSKRYYGYRYRGGDDPYYRTEYSWPTGETTVAEATTHIVMTALGYAGLATLALLLARSRLRWMKE